MTTAVSGLVPRLCGAQVLMLRRPGVQLAISEVEFSQGSVPPHQYTPNTPCLHGAGFVDLTGASSLCALVGSSLLAFPKPVQCCCVTELALGVI